MDRPETKPSTIDRAASFRLEWNAAFIVVATIATTLLLGGHRVIGGMALALCATAVAARYLAMRKANRHFYGQDKRSADAGG
jgi:hypothetical protein